MTKNEVLSLYQGLQGVSRYEDVKFTYAVAKNINILKREVKLIDQERRAIAIKHFKKDEKGEPIIKDGQHVLDDPDKVQEELDALMEQPATTDFKFYLIDFSLIPKTISASEMADLEPLIKES